MTSASQRSIPADILLRPKQPIGQQFNWEPDGSCMQLIRGQMTIKTIASCDKQRKTALAGHMGVGCDGKQAVTRVSVDRWASLIVSFEHPASRSDTIRQYGCMQIARQIRFDASQKHIWNIEISAPKITPPSFPVSPRLRLASSKLATVAADVSTSYVLVFRPAPMLSHFRRW